MRMTLKKLQDNLPITVQSEEVSKIVFTCRSCGKSYPTVLKAFECKCNKKVNWKTCSIGGRGRRNYYIESVKKEELNEHKRKVKEIKNDTQQN